MKLKIQFCTSHITVPNVNLFSKQVFEFANFVETVELSKKSDVAKVFEK